MLTDYHVFFLSFFFKGVIISQTVSNKNIEPYKDENETIKTSTASFNLASSSDVHWPRSKRGLSLL